MALKLVNRVYSYIVITINTIINIFLTNIDPFIYNIILYYTAIKFINIIINIKAFKYFTVGHN